MAIYSKKISISPLLINDIEHYCEVVEKKIFNLCISKSEYTSLRLDDIGKLQKKRNKIVGFGDGKNKEI